MTKLVNKKKIKVVEKFLLQKISDRPGEVTHIAKKFIDSREEILKLTEKYETPFYLIDKKQLEASINNFKHTFAKFIPNSHYFYAMKSNDNTFILKEVVKAAFGIDVSSSRELNLAIEAGAKAILFSGPAKIEKDLELAYKYKDRVILNIDSFSELRRLGVISNQKKQVINVGVRVYTKYHGRWTKFGISLEEIHQFWDEIKQYKYINLQGLQCHMSWSESTLPYENMIREISSNISQKLSKEQIASIKFIDLGGGFFPYNTEGYYPWATPQGKVLKIVSENENTELIPPIKYFISKSVKLKTFAQAIATSLQENLIPLLSKDIKFFFEPGRVISTSSMHIVLKIMDIKKDFAITDGGSNITGWEKELNSYMPVINLTNPSLEEKAFRIYGSLCTPDDIWGYYCFAEKFSEGDIILLPNRGAYSYSMAQTFIRPIPPVRYF